MRHVIGGHASHRRSSDDLIPQDVCTSIFAAAIEAPFLQNGLLLYKTQNQTLTSEL